METNLFTKQIPLLSLLLLVLFCSQYSMAQTTEWTYLSGSGNGLSIKITEVDNKIKMVHFSQKNGQDWINMQILKINGKADYIRVKSPATDKVYELAVFWYEEKIIRTIFNDTKLIYWLKK